jgi:ABC-type nitrate/sulfonate/bicarbonate transport system substrate-binding protein
MTTRVRIAHSSHGAGNAPTSQAIDAGYFLDVGIDLVMVETSNTSDAIAMVAAGDAEFAVAAGGPILNAAMQGADPLIVMSIEGHNIFAVMGARTIASPADLRGAKIAVTGPTDQDTIIIGRALREWGIDTDEVELTRVADRGAAWAAMVAGDVAAMAATAPQPILARSLGLPVLRDFSELREPYQLGSIATTRSLAGREPDLLRAFLTAQLRGVALFRSDVEQALPYLRARSKLTDDDVLRATHEIFAGQLANCLPSVAALAAVARDLAATTGAPVSVDLERLVDPSFIMSVER